MSDSDTPTPDRLEQIERDLARLKSKDQPLGPPPPPPLSQVASEAMRLQEEARLERLKAAELAADAERLQAEKDAPLQAKRQKALAALDEKIAAVEAEGVRVEGELCRLRVARLRLANEPLRKGTVSAAELQQARMLAMEQERDRAASERMASLNGVRR